ncbi:class I mannose-6-phosphate isomerase [Actinomadura fibrosa]|uniref:Class I mannose-6-phosphate isomerase n=1 Tax=Actinomadura fibrosa TaxID=111802 RepID=A0ABW2XDD5_9ACTN|nr:class I mannose-6-phosphate isomerase [Actinomadura fibrosa]
MDWHPLRLTTPVKAHVFGGRAIADRLGRTGLPPGRVAETWEVSDVDGEGAEVADGPLAGHSLRDLATEHPEELMGRGWRGDRFPLLTKYIDATGALPVHLHADDETAVRLEGQPNGKTEAWHILDARPGATALAGTRPGVDAATLREALLRGDFDSVMRRLPVVPGQTIYIPGGTLHSFGPDTLVYEIEQTSDIQQHAMPWRMEDGSPIGPDERHRNIDMLLAEWRPDPRPRFHPGLVIPVSDGVQRTVCCAGRYFALERWQAAAGTRMHLTLRTATIVSNAGAPARLSSGNWSGTLEAGSTLLLPAVLGEAEVSGPADVLLGYLPDLPCDIEIPLAKAGHSHTALTTLTSDATEASVTRRS